MNTWLITDTHLGHANIIRYANRPEDHEWRILNNLSTIQDNDEVIHLGDVCMGKDQYWHNELLSRLYNVNTILVLGNHDHKSRQWYLDAGWGAVVDGLLLKINTKRIWLTHYPSKQIVGDVNIHGHLHNHPIDNDIVERYKYSTKYHRLLAMEKTDYKPVNIKDFL